MPTELKTLRSLPLQFGHSVSAGSENDCTASSCSPHSVQAYWYVGTDPPAYSMLNRSGAWHSPSKSANAAPSEFISSTPGPHLGLRLLEE